MERRFRPTWIADSAIAALAQVVPQPVILAASRTLPNGRSGKSVAGQAKSEHSACRTGEAKGGRHAHRLGREPAFFPFDRGDSALYEQDFGGTARQRRRRFDDDERSLLRRRRHGPPELSAVDRPETGDRWSTWDD